MFHIAGGILLAVFILYIFAISGPLIRAILLIVGAFCISRVLGGIVVVASVVVLTIGGVYFGFQVVAETKIGGLLFRWLGLMCGALIVCYTVGTLVLWFLNPENAFDWLGSVAPGGWGLAAIPIVGAVALGMLWLVFGRYGPLGRDSEPSLPTRSSAAPERAEPRLLNPGKRIDGVKPDDVIL